MEKPSVYVYVVTFNDGLILPYFIRHYLTFCEKIFIYDNCSTDNTAQIVAEFDNVFLKEFDTNNRFSERVLLDIKNNVWKENKSDLAIVCDTDEFLYHPNINRFLKRFVSCGYTVGKCCGYDMFSDKFPTTVNQIYHDVRIGQINTSYDKILIFDPNKISAINYDPGCHTALPEGVVKVYRDDLSLKLLHFKWLGLEYVLARHKVAFSRLSDENVENKWGIQYFPEHQAKVSEYYHEQLSKGELLVL